MQGLPQIRSNFLGAPTIRIIVFRSLHWGPPIGDINNKDYSIKGLDFGHLLRDMTMHGRPYNKQ